MNRYPFSLLARGVYGRKTAYTDVDEITVDNIVKVVADCVGVFNHNKPLIKYLWDYKNGDQPILYRQKAVRPDCTFPVVENHAWEIVRFKNAQTYGEPVQLVSLSKDENVNKAVDLFNTYMSKAHKHVCDVSSGEWTSAVGTGYKAVSLRHMKDIPFALNAPTPMDTFVIYYRKTEEPACSVQELRDSDGERYFSVFTPTFEVKIKNSKLVPFKDGNVTRLHVFGAVPIVEYPNNSSRISDIELVISMLDALNELSSNRVEAVMQFVQSWIKFVNCEVDPGTFQQMKMMGALVVKSNNADNKADVDIMTQELNQTQTQVAKDDLLDNVFAIDGVPSRENKATGGDSQGAVQLRAGWDFSKNAANMKDPYIVQGEERLSEVVLNILRVEKRGEINLTPMDYEIVINHSPLDNLQVKTQCLQMLLTMGIHPLVAIKVSGIWSDAEKVFMTSKPYLDAKYKTIDDMIKEQNLQQQLADAQALVNATKTTGGDTSGNGQAE